MKKAICLLIVACSACLALHAQDVDKVRKDFEAMMKGGKVPYGQNKAAGKYYSIRGFKMYAETYGHGQPVLFIHGNGGSINNFVKQIPYFSTKYKVIVADSRAQGKSSDNSDSLSYEMMADDYDALLSAMHIDSAYVVGWSDGGINALLLAIRHPGKVRKLAITGANLRPDTSAVPQDIWDMVLPDYSALKSKSPLSASEKAGFKLLRLLCEQPHISADELSTIRVPALVIGGDHDVIRPRHTLEIAESIPQSYLWIIPRSGHSTPVVYAKDFNAKVDEFFVKPYRAIEKQARFF